MRTRKDTRLWPAGSCGRVKQAHNDTTSVRCKQAIQLEVACGAIADSCGRSGLRDRRAWGANSTTGHRKFAELVRHFVFTGASSCLVHVLLYCIVAFAISPLLAGTKLELPITGSLDAGTESGKWKFFPLAEISAGHIACCASGMPVCCVLWLQFCESEVLIETTKAYLGFRHAE